MSRPQNWRDGVKKSRAVRSARAKERAEGITVAFYDIARRHGPNTLSEYARIMNEECHTPSGRGQWSISLVHRYMKSSGWTPKELRRVFFRDQTDLVVEHPAHLFAAWRTAIAHVHSLTEANGAWISAIVRNLKPKQDVRHVRFGIGVSIEPLSLGSHLCSFPGEDGLFEEKVCRLIDLDGFEFFRTFEDRQQECIDARDRIFAHSQKGLRKLTDGWFL